MATSATLAAAATPIVLAAGCGCGRSWVLGVW